MKLLKKLFIGSLAPAVGLTLSMSANADYDVDLFNGDLQFAQDFTNGDGAVSDIDGPGDAPRSDILGGYRDLYAECISLCTSIEGTTISANSGGTGLLKFSTAASVTGTGEVVWDGLAGAGINGATGYDLTDGGAVTDLLTVTIESDGGGEFFWEFSTTVTDVDGVSTTIILLATKVPDPFFGITSPYANTISLLGFNDCGYAGGDPRVISVTCSDGAGGTGPDLTRIHSLSVLFNVSGGIAGQVSTIDLAVDSVRGVPEPSVIGLMGIALAAFGFTRRRRAQV